MALPTIHLDGPQVDTPLSAIEKMAAAMPEISQRLLLLERTGFQQGLYDPDPSNPAYSFSAKGSPWSAVTKRAMYAGTTTFDQVHPVGDGKFVTASGTLKLFSTAPDGTITKIAESVGAIASVTGVVATSPTSFKVLTNTVAVYDMLLDGASLTYSLAGSQSNHYQISSSSNKRARLASGKIAQFAYCGLNNGTQGGIIGFTAAAQAQSSGYLGGGAFAHSIYNSHGFTHDYLTPGRTIAAWRETVGSSSGLAVGVFELDATTNGRVLDQVVVDSGDSTGIYIYTLGPTLAIVSYVVGGSRRMQVLNVSASTGRITALGSMLLTGAGLITPRVGKPQDATRLFVCQQNADTALSSIISVDTATGALTKNDIPGSTFGAGAGTIIDISKLGPDRLIVSGRDGTTGTSYGLQVWDLS